MAIESASGHPVYSGNFIPEVWSTKLAVKFYDATVCAAISNTDYEGEIKDMGDKVHIRTTPDITIKDYRKGQTLDYETPDSNPLELQIDRGKYWGFNIDDIDKYQSDIKMLDDWSSDAGEKMKIEIDTDFLGSIYADADAANTGATAGRVSGAYSIGVTGAPISLATDNIMDYIVHLGSVLDEQSIPESGRWLVLPTWAANRVKRSELKDASLSGDGTSMLRNGRMGMLDRFTTYQSNLVPSVVDGSDTCYHIMAGHKSCVTFASQIVKTESLKAERTFGTLVRGLNVYGFKVVNGKGIADLYAKPGAPS